MDIRRLPWLSHFFEVAITERGDLWWTDFGDPVGSAPGYRRPGVVV